MLVKQKFEQQGSKMEKIEKKMEKWKPKTEIKTETKEKFNPANT